MDAAEGRIDTSELTRAVEILRLLADPTRLEVLALLSNGERTVSDLAATLNRPMPAISQHLAKLRAGGLVVTRRQGTSIHYSQPNEHVSALVDNVLLQAEHLLYNLPPHHQH